MLSSCHSMCKSFRSTTQVRKKVHYNVPVWCRISDALRTRKVHVMRSLNVMSYCVTRTYLKDFTT